MSKKKKKEEVVEEVDTLEEITDEEVEDLDSENEDPAPVLEQPLHELYGENPPLHILNKFS